jgi:hypothetical protein
LDFGLLLLGSMIRLSCSGKLLLLLWNGSNGWTGWTFLNQRTWFCDGIDGFIGFFDGLDGTREV